MTSEKRAIAPVRSGLRKKSPGKNEGITMVTSVSLCHISRLLTHYLLYDMETVRIAVRARKTIIPNLILTRPPLFPPGTLR